VRQIVLVVELETLGIVDESGGTPEPAQVPSYSTPPPLD
jgi:hypothetical protein